MRVIPKTRINEICMQKGEGEREKGKKKNIQWNLSSSGLTEISWVGEEAVMTKREGWWWWVLSILSEWSMKQSVEWIERQTKQTELRLKEESVCVCVCVWVREKRNMWWNGTKSTGYRCLVINFKPKRIQLFSHPDRSLPVWNKTSSVCTYESVPSGFGRERGSSFLCVCWTTLPPLGMAPLSNRREKTNTVALLHVSFLFFLFWIN